MFTGTLVSYDPDPAFMLHWDKAKVKEEDLPKDDKKPAPSVPQPRSRPKLKPLEEMSKTALESSGRFVL